MDNHDIHLGKCIFDNSILTENSDFLCNVVTWASKLNKNNTDDSQNSKNTLKRASESILTAFKKIKINTPSDSISPKLSDISAFKPPPVLSKILDSSYVHKTMRTFFFKNSSLLGLRANRKNHHKSSAFISGCANNKNDINTFTGRSLYQPLLLVCIKSFLDSLKTSVCFFQFILIIDNQSYIFPHFKRNDFKNYIISVPFESGSEAYLYLYRVEQQKDMKSSVLDLENKYSLTSTISNKKILPIQSFNGSELICLYEHRPFNNTIILNEPTKSNLIGKLTINLKSKHMGGDFRAHILQPLNGGSNSKFQKSKVKINMKYNIIKASINTEADVKNGNLVYSSIETSPATDTLNFNFGRCIPNTNSHQNYSLATPPKRNISSYIQYNYITSNDKIPFFPGICCLTCINPANTIDNSLLSWKNALISLNGSDFNLVFADSFKALSNQNYILSLNNLVSITTAFLTSRYEPHPCLELIFQFDKFQENFATKNTGNFLDPQLTRFDNVNDNSFLKMLDNNKTLKLLIKFKETDHFNICKYNIDLSTIYYQKYSGTPLNLKSNAEYADTHTNNSATFKSVFKDGCSSLKSSPSSDNTIGFKQIQHLNSENVRDISQTFYEKPNFENYTFSNKRGMHQNNNDIDSDSSCSSAYYLNETETVNIVDIIGTAKLMNSR
ncbi:hypothetical protein BB561_000563 [Smittium simulii]|uniref:Uncharacterized protein n=1 Tax=Smittium simulii TaxID=133385 RepID=A0A2T9YYS7_9FUNG|nr:hypothetical protein BB561_000563 [Smittium simulii]